MWAESRGGVGRIHFHRHGGSVPEDIPGSGGGWFLCRNGHGGPAEIRKAACFGRRGVLARGNGCGIEGRAQGCGRFRNVLLHGASRSADLHASRRVYPHCWRGRIPVDGAGCGAPCGEVDRGGIGIIRGNRCRCNTAQGFASRGRRRFLCSHGIGCGIHPRGDWRFPSSGGSGGLHPDGLSGVDGEIRDSTRSRVQVHGAAHGAYLELGGHDGSHLRR